MSPPSHAVGPPIVPDGGEGCCPLCSGAAGNPAHPYGTIFQGRHFRFVACRHCGTRFIDPLPDAMTLAALYAPEVYHDHFYATSANDRHDASRALLLERLTAGARVLDYGCGNGDFLLAAQDVGFDVGGAEYGAAALAAEMRTGRPVIDLASTKDLPGDWDAIHLADVLEHLIDPQAAIAALVAALRPGGYLVAEGPLEANASLVAWVAALFARMRNGQRGANNFVPWHLFLTNARAQRAFFARLGLVEQHWSVWENGWPYLHNGRARHAIARMARAFARLPVARGRVGNRFRALYRKPI